MLDVKTFARNVSIAASEERSLSSLDRPTPGRISVRNYRREIYGRPDVVNCELIGAIDPLARAVRVIIAGRGRSAG